MSSHEPMTQEQLHAIRDRLDCGTPTTEDVSILLAEVERLRALTTVDDAMVKRATHGIAAHWHDMHTNESLGRQQALAIAALNAALGTEEGTA